MPDDSRMSVRFPPDLIRWARIHRAITGETMNDLVVRLVAAEKERSEAEEQERKEVALDAHHP